MTAAETMIVPWGSGRVARALVYGLKLSGTSAARFLAERGVAVLGVDKKTREELDPAALESLSALAPGAIELRLGAEPSEPPAGIDLVVVSPGVPMDRPLLAAARARGIPVIAEVELAHPFLDGPIAAITGSNGKSTTTELLGAMLRAAGRRVEVCGNIGTPICDRVAGEPGRAFVVELSSFQIEGIERFHPRAAALLNLSEDHLDRYPGMAEYAAAKKRLFRNLTADDVAVLNADDPWTLEVETPARRRQFSRRRPVADGCYVDGAGKVVEIDRDGARTELFAAADVPLAGVQNVENAMAAALLARALGAGPAAVRAALAGFRGLPHRLERIGERDGVIWYDDSKGTNPAATEKSVEGFADGTVHLILGGRNKGADLSTLAATVRGKARRVYLIGESATEFQTMLAAAGLAERTELAETLERAVDSARVSARAGEVVVLSPACASFDQFRNFEHRGQVFQELVRSRVLAAEGKS